jgi:hypothetical protein
VIWTHSDDHKKKLKYPELVSTPNCPSPFVDIPSTDFKHLQTSGKLTHDPKLVGCSYDLKFKREDNSVTDPHIKVGN